MIKNLELQTWIIFIEAINWGYSDTLLEQITAGQINDSPCLNSGSDSSEKLELNNRTTRTDNIGDEGIVDIGYHYPVVVFEKPVLTNIERTASITITWQSQVYMSYRIESSVDPYDYDENNNMTWINEIVGLANSGTTTSWTDTAAAAEKYYRIYTISPSGDLKADDTVGQMTILVKVGRNLISSPFEPYPVDGGTPGSSTLDKIVGNQLTGHGTNKNLSDNIEVWFNGSGQYKRAWFDSLPLPGTWKDWDTGSLPVFGMDADKGYWFNILPIPGHTEKTVVFCGRVSKTNRSIPIALGRNLVGSCFPVSCTLAKSGLVLSGFTGHQSNKNLSDNVEFWNNSTLSYDRYWYKTGTTNEWQPWTVGGTLRNINPCDAIWINVLNIPGHGAFAWTYPVPPRP